MVRLCRAEATSVRVGGSLLWRWRIFADMNGLCFPMARCSIAPLSDSRHKAVPSEALHWRSATPRGLAVGLALRQQPPLECRNRPETNRFAAQHRAHSP